MRRSQHLMALGFLGILLPTPAFAASIVDKRFPNCIARYLVPQGKDATLSEMTERFSALSAYKAQPNIGKLNLELSDQIISKAVDRFHN
ncbi:UNVERIFIED_ORG: hypothetical protein LHK14_01770 [Roseateles sp. XES5]|nr:hypothetical protein [Roseateles sp. XES5]